MPSRSPHCLTPLRMPTFSAGRRICKIYVEVARQVSGDDGAYDGGWCGLPTTALLTSRRPPGEVSSPFTAQIGASAWCRLVPTGVPYGKFSTCITAVHFVNLGCGMLFRHPILSLGTFSRNSWANWRSYNLVQSTCHPKIPQQPNVAPPACPFLGDGVCALCFSLTL